MVLNENRSHKFNPIHSNLIVPSLPPRIHSLDLMLGRNRRELQSKSSAHLQAEGIGKEVGQGTGATWRIQPHQDISGVQIRMHHIVY